MNIVHKVFFKVSKFLPIKRHFSDLEKISTDDLLEYGKMSVLPAFRKITRNLPFYKKILNERGVKISSIKTLSDFYEKVPVLKKEDIFPIFKAHELCMNGTVSDMVSAIVTSGTSGIFAYGILTKEDIAFQRKMIDEVLEYYFNAKKESLLVINALAMGVNFSSSYPVISTSVRSDIVLHIIKTFSSYYKKTVVICDPHFAKKIIEEGRELNFSWPDLNVSFVVGGTGSSSSLQRYLLDSINVPNYDFPKNTIQGTMGLTEVGLNIFSAPPELIRVRGILEKNEKLREDIFGAGTSVCPELFFYYPTNVHIEIQNADDRGFGDIVLSNLDTKSKTPLVRYNAGDLGMFVDRKKIADVLRSDGHGATLKLQLPIIAIVGRHKDHKIKNLTPAIVEEALYRDHQIASSITGHFKILQIGSSAEVRVQAKPDAQRSYEISSRIGDILKGISSADFVVECKPYKDFGYDLELNYEKKWKNSQ